MFFRGVLKNTPRRNTHVIKNDPKSFFIGGAGNRVLDFASTSFLSLKSSFYRGCLKSRCSISNFVKNYIKGVIRNFIPLNATLPRYLKILWCQSTQVISLSSGLATRFPRKSGRQRMFWLRIIKGSRVCCKPSNVLAVRKYVWYGGGIPFKRS